MYKLTKSDKTILRKSDGAQISKDSSNSDYREYEAWVAAGNVAEPVDPPTIAEENAPILAEIAAIEATQSRAIREHILGDTLALDRLRAIDDKIKLARGKLKK